MKYPQLSLRETNAPYMEEMKTAAAEVIEGGWYIRGKYVSRLEEQLCAYLGCRYAVATGNGLDACVMIKSLELFNRTLKLSDIGFDFIGDKLRHIIGNFKL